MNKNARNSWRRLNNESGFTLIELVAAAILISGVIVGLFSALVSANAFMMPHTNVSREIARMHMESFREGVRGDWWGDPSSFNTTNVGTSGMPLTLPATWQQDLPLGTVTADGITYTVTYKVTRMYVGSPPTGLGGDYRRVQVDVTW